jgi:hypothetical protein
MVIMNLEDTINNTLSWFYRPLSAATSSPLQMPITSQAGDPLVETSRHEVDANMFSVPYVREHDQAAALRRAHVS